MNTSAEIAGLEGRIAALERALAEKSHSEGKLRAERDFLKTVVDSTETMLNVIDAGSFKVVLNNKKIMEYSGFHHSEFTSDGRADARENLFVAAEDMGKIQAQIREAAATKRPVTTELWMLTKEGARKRIAWTCIAVFDDPGTPRYFVTSGLDVTARWEAEETLRKERDFYSKVLDTTAAMIAALDLRTGRMAVYNRSIRENSGYTEEDIMSSPHPADSPAIPLEERQQFMEDIRNVIATKRVFTREMWNIKKDGNRSRNEWRVRALFNEAGAPTHIISAGFSVEDRYRAEEALKKEKEFLDTILDTTEAMIMVLDLENYRTLVHNRALAVASGFAAGEVVLGAGPADFPGIPEDERENFLKFFYGVVSSKKAATHEMWNVSKNGDKRRILWSARATYKPDGRPEYMIASGTDVTDRWRAEQAQREAKEQAEAANELKNKFVMMVSHNLSSPLAAIHFALKQLAYGQRGPVNKDHKEILDKINRSCGGLLNTINNLLSHSRFQSGAMKIEAAPIETRKMVDGVIERVHGIAASKGISIENRMPKGTVIKADLHLVEEVIQNLLVNAVKYSHPGGPITVYRPEERAACIAVRDRGRGIDPAMLPFLFSHEVKTSTPGTEGEKGAGLGLPLCNDIMKSHGGTITAERAEDGGSVFYLEFPPLAPTGEHA